MRPEYHPDWVMNPDEMLRHLLQLDWLLRTEARREYFMSDTQRSYAYGRGDGRREYPSEPFSPHVYDLLTQLNNATEADYNVCFLNRYDGQRQHLGWHADDSPEMDGRHPIAVVSLGAVREIWWRPHGWKGEVPPENRQPLHHGSLFVMPAGFQDLYQHRIPKSDRVVGTRISLTFRRYADV